MWLSSFSFNKSLRGNTDEYFLQHFFSLIFLVLQPFNCLLRKKKKMNHALLHSWGNLFWLKSPERHNLLCSRCSFNDALMPYVKSHHLLWRLTFLLIAPSNSNASCWWSPHTTQITPAASIFNSSFMLGCTQPMLLPSATPFKIK